MTPAEILAKLLNGQVLLHSVTIPEGLTFVQIADVVSQPGLTDRAEFLRLAKDREFIASLNIKAETLEGYLYPDTYKFPRGVKAREVLTVMVEQRSEELVASVKAEAARAAGRPARDLLIAVIEASFQHFHKHRGYIAADLLAADLDIGG